ncbi:hypothetical protein AVL50_21390 [Flammeovirga sp. SJP92]|nr:hypothetical protein AVL50_21390 [Flammeovirga sp. SJP92]
MIFNVKQIMRFFLFLISFYALIFSQISFANSSIESEINRADEFFESKQYIDAFNIYEKILEEDRVYSSKMLLRMAFIQEGQGNYASALYYLNLQYGLTADRGTLNKMSKIAEDHNLLGYQYSDKEYLTSLFNKMKSEIGGVIIFLLIVCVVLMYMRRKEQHSITTLTVAVCVLSVLALWAFNGGMKRELGIVKGSGALLMQGPSAGSKNISNLSSGERLKLVDQDDIWYKVVLPNDSEGYVRKGMVFEVK